MAFASFAAGAPLGAALGVALGGALVQTTAYVFFYCPPRSLIQRFDGRCDSPTWRTPFFLESALNFLCLVGGLVSIDPDVPFTETDKRIDWLGAFLVTAGLVLIVFVLGQGESAPQQWRTGCESVMSNQSLTKNIYPLPRHRHYRAANPWCPLRRPFSRLAGTFRAYPHHSLPLRF